MGFVTEVVYDATSLLCARWCEQTFVLNCKVLHVYSSVMQKTNFTLFYSLITLPLQTDFSQYR